MKTENAQQFITRLLRGVAMHNAELVRDNWRCLVGLGPAAAPAIQEKLVLGDWTKYQNEIQAHNLTILISLLIEIDSKRAESTLTQLLNSTLHPLHKQAVTHAKSALVKSGTEIECRGVPVFISDELQDFARKQMLLKKWMNSPSEKDLKMIGRIDVIADQSAFDFLGQYNIRFSKVILTWPEVEESRMLRWAQELQIETTLYHEIGHHCLGHIEGGQVESQEQEADGYANKLILQSHPGIATMWMPVKLVRKLIQIFRSRQSD